MGVITVAIVALAVLVALQVSGRTTGQGAGRALMTQPSERQTEEEDAEPCLPCEELEELRANLKVLQGTVDKLRTNDAKQDTRIDKLQGHVSSLTGELTLPEQGNHSLKIKTSAAHYSGGDAVTIEIFSDDCEDVCTAVNVSGLTSRGTDYNQTFAASNFGDPTRLRLTATGDDFLKLNWVDVYNAHTERSYRFPCPSGGCRLSTDTSEGNRLLDLYLKVCPSGYVPFQDGERCFGFSTDKRNYTKARSACHAAGGHLALPKDKATNAFLVNQINSRYPNISSVWFGLTDQVEEGTFVWEDGTPLNGWSDWSTGQADDYESVEDCATYTWRREYGYKWNDVPCTVSRFYVCEVGAAAP